MNNLKTKSVFFVMPNLGGGGGERVISILLNNLDRSLYEPNLIIIKNNGANTFIKNLNPDVTVHYLKVNGRIRVTFPYVVYKLLKFCRQYKPDVLFFGSGQINAIISPFLFLFPKNIKTIARESNIPSQFEKHYIIKCLYRYTYRNYTKIVVQSDDMYNDLHLNFKLPKRKLIKINNPIDISFIKKNLLQKLIGSLADSKLNLIAVGRLTHQKGFDILIKELSQITNLDFHLTILGDGEEKESLNQLVKTNKLEERVTFLGNVENPYVYMKTADLFVLSSRFEGFPNVVLETLVCGTRVLANNCLGGISEIIKPGFNGEVFSFKKNDFEEKLIKIMNTNFDKQNIIDDTIRRFSISHKIEEFHNVIESE